MYTTRNQRTLAATTSIEGVGYWSGQDVRLEFHPGESGTGLVFVRADLPGRPRIPATVCHRTDTPRRTTLQCRGASVEMIEHVMAALAGLRIDNCEIWVDRSEMPGLDGSAKPLVEALDAAGIVVQNAPRRCELVRQVLRLGDRRCRIEARPNCSGATVLEYELDYGDQSPIGHQKRRITLTPEVFREELAPSRTFMPESEALALRAQGLGQRATYRDLLVFGPRGPIDNRLRFADECVRHKLLDMVGDLALAGCDLAGRFIAYRSGHHLNAELVRQIAAGVRCQHELKRCA